jgi:hypothetical protein
MGASPRELAGEIERYDRERPDPSRPPLYTPEPKQTRPANPSKRELARHSFRPTDYLEAPRPQGPPEPKPRGRSLKPTSYDPPPPPAPRLPPSTKPPAPPN